MFPGCMQMATLIVAGPISTGGLIALFLDGLGLRIDALERQREL